MKNLIAVVLGFSLLSALASASLKRTVHLECEDPIDLESGDLLPGSMCDQVKATFDDSDNYVVSVIEDHGSYMGSEMVSVPAKQVPGSGFNLKFATSGETRKTVYFSMKGVPTDAKVPVTAVVMDEGTLAVCRKVISDKSSK